MAKKKRKDEILRLPVRSNKQKGRYNILLVEAAEASTRARREYGQVFEELAKYDKQ